MEMIKRVGPLDWRARALYCLFLVGTIETFDLFRWRPSSSFGFGPGEQFAEDKLSCKWRACARRVLGWSWWFRLAAKHARKVGRE